MDNKKAIEVLNSLVEINNDRIEGYDIACGETDSSSLKSMFLNFKSTSEKCRQQLADEIKRCGGTAEEGYKNNRKTLQGIHGFESSSYGK